MEKAKLVLHHDDPPCDKRLEKDGSCRSCQLTPDMQSTCLWSYCPSCDVPLEKMVCPTCRKTFKMPA